MSNKISRTDVTDNEFVDAVELASDGYSASYRTVGLVSTTAATRYVVISTPTDLDRLDNVDEPIQIGDFLEIDSGAAAGKYTVDAIVNPDSTFRVLENVADSAGGSGNLYHPSGASKVGFNPGNLENTSALNVQDAISELDSAISDIDGYQQALPDATQIGQVLFSVDGGVFERVLPITSRHGWLVNDYGIHIVIPEDC